jgi:hypothetical protein
LLPGNQVLLPVHRVPGNPLEADPLFVAFGAQPLERDTEQPRGLYFGHQRLNFKRSGHKLPLSNRLHRGPGPLGFLPSEKFSSNRWSVYRADSVVIV